MFARSFAFVVRSHTVSMRHPASHFVLSRSIRRPSKLPTVVSSPGHIGRNFSIVASITDKLNSRYEAKESEKMKEQFSKMANLKSFTLRHYLDEINAGLTDWRAKIPGIRKNDKIKQLKITQSILQAVTEEIGDQLDPTSHLGRKEKLRISLRCGRTAEEVNDALREFETMSIMHAVIRRTLDDGGKIPESREDLEEAMTANASKVLSKKKLRELAGSQVRKMGGVKRR
uniref:Uncharacterized protein n=1 Tax=Corethron hystrix TaxID=216773 RepID=A0A6U5KA11_9STRA